jgi:hypothetical protein
LEPPHEEASDLHHVLRQRFCWLTGYSIEDPLMRNIRHLDKLIDELAKGRPIEKILRK